MRIYDISVPITPNMHRYPGDAAVSIVPLAAIGEGSHYALSKLVLGSHTGTHVDPPAHFVSGGVSADQLPLETLIGPAKVVEVADGRAVTAALLERSQLPSTTERVLFKTQNGRLWEKARFQ